MIRRVDISGATYNCMYAQNGQRPQEWSLLKRKDFDSVKPNDPPILICYVTLGISYIQVAFIQLYTIC